MPKPSTVPTWATSGSAYKSDPGAPKRALGWLAGEKPPADWWNKIWNEIGEWLTWLDGLQAEALTWTGVQTFSLASVFTAGFSSVALAIFKAALRAEVTGTGARTLVAEFTIPAATGQKVRLYAATAIVDALPGLEISVNAAWNGTQWVPDATADCYVYEMSQGRWRMRKKAGTAATPFLDNTFTDLALIDSAGVPSFPGLINSQPFYVSPEEFTYDAGLDLPSVFRATATYPGYASAAAADVLGATARFKVPAGTSLQDLELFFHNQGSGNAVLGTCVVAVYTRNPGTAPTAITDAYTILVCKDFTGTQNLAAGDARWLTPSGGFTPQTVPADSIVCVSFSITASDAPLDFGGARLRAHAPLALAP